MTANKALIKVQDTKYKDGKLIVSFLCKAGDFEFNKAFKFDVGKKIDKSKVREKLGLAIKEEVDKRRAIDEFTKWGEEGFKVAYESKNKES